MLLLLLLSYISHVRLCVTPSMAAHQAPFPGILQARILEWVAISFSSAWKWKVKVKSLSHVRLFVTLWTVAYQAAPSMGFPRQEYWSGLPLSSPILAYSEPFFFLMKSQYAWLPVQMTTAERRVKLGVIRQHFSNLSDQRPFHNNKTKKIVAPSLQIWNEIDM